MLYDSGNIEDVEYQIYNKWFDEFSDIELSGIVYVNVSPEVCLDRTQKRNRKGEQSIPLKYLHDCHRYHEMWLAGVENVLVVRDNNFNLREFVKKSQKINYTMV